MYFQFLINPVYCYILQLNDATCSFFPHLGVGAGLGTGGVPGGGQYSAAAKAAKYGIMNNTVRTH